MPVQIADQSFPSQEAAKNHVRGLLRTVGPEGMIDPSHPQFSFFLSLAERHPEWSRKAGPGLDHFIVRDDSFSGALAFDVVRIDGSRIDISFHNCVTGKKKNRPSKSVLQKDAKSFF